MKLNYNFKNLLLCLLILLIFSFIAGCGHVQVTLPDVDKQGAAEAGACEAGYQFAKHFPDEAQVALEYAQAAFDATEPMDFNEQFKVWKDYALEKAGLNAHYRRQLDKFMPNITLPEGQLPTPEWIKKAKPFLQEFIYGIEDGLEDFGPLAGLSFQDRVDYYYVTMGHWY